MEFVGPLLLFLAVMAVVFVFTTVFKAFAFGACSKCGKVRQMGEKFCSQCGEEF